MSARPEPMRNHGKIEPDKWKRIETALRQGVTARDCMDRFGIGDSSLRKVKRAMEQKQKAAS